MELHLSQRIKVNYILLPEAFSFLYQYETIYASSAVSLPHIHYVTSPLKTSCNIMLITIYISRGFRSLTKRGFEQLTNRCEISIAYKDFFFWGRLQNEFLITYKKTGFQSLTKKEFLIAYKNSGLTIAYKLGFGSLTKKA